MAPPYDGEEHLQALLQAVTQLGALDGFNQAWCDSACLGRYLRARKGDINKAAKLLHSTLEWRNKIGITSLRVEEFSSELKSGKMYIQGNDAAGRSILVTRKRSDAFKSGEYDHYIRHMAFTLETACRNMKSGAESWVWIMDMAGMTRANSPPINVSLATLHILADHYPERLHRCFIVDAPTIFSYLWAAVSPFIDPETKKKVAFIKSSEWRSKMEQKQKQQQAAVTTAANTPSTVEQPTPDATGHAEQSPPQQQKQHGTTGQAAAEGDFSHYWEVYNSPYDEGAYRELLTAVGWK